MAFGAESRELKAARSLVPEIRAAARAAERARRLPDSLVRSFSEAGLVQMAVPRQYGGLESHALDLLRVTEEVSYGDGSAGWVLMNYQTTALCSGLLPKDWGEAIFAGPERAIPAGVLSPTGRGRRVEGGMVVDGRWGFASGCPGANWLLATAIMDVASDEPGDKGPSITSPASADPGATTS
jgi:alkylation response protein AidB-like acyl-CoA dehydrogenase